MKLSKMQWEELWRCIETIEQTNMSMIPDRRKIIFDEVNKMKRIIKDYMKQVIMEHNNETGKRNMSRV